MILNDRRRTPAAVGQTNPLVYELPPAFWVSPYIAFYAATVRAMFLRNGWELFAWTSTARGAYLHGGGLRNGARVGVGRSRGDSGVACCPVLSTLAIDTEEFLAPRDRLRRAIPPVESSFRHEENTETSGAESVCEIHQTTFVEYFLRRPYHADGFLLKDDVLGRVRRSREAIPGNGSWRGPTLRAGRLNTTGGFSPSACGVIDELTNRGGVVQ